MLIKDKKLPGSKGLYGMAEIKPLRSHSHEMLKDKRGTIL